MLWAVAHVAGPCFLRCMACHATVLMISKHGAVTPLHPGTASCRAWLPRTPLSHATVNWATLGIARLRLSERGANKSAVRALGRYAAHSRARSAAKIVGARSAASTPVAPWRYLAMRRAWALVTRPPFDALELITSAVTATGSGGPFYTAHTCTDALIARGRAYPPRPPLLQLAINGAFVFIAVRYLKQSRAGEATMLVVAHDVA